MVIKGFGGPAAEIFCPLWSDLADLAVVYERTGASFVPVDWVAEERAVRACGDYVEVHDHDEIVPAALAYAADNPVDGILTISEPLLCHTAEIAERLELPHHNPLSAARIVTDKFEQREALRRAGMPTPRHAAITGSDDLVPALESVGLPAVLKPAFGAGSMLIFRVDSADDLERHYRESLERRDRSELERGVDARFDLEELIVNENWHRDERFGSYVSVETLMVDGEFHALNVSDRTAQLPPFRETGLLLPSSLPADHQVALVDAARGAAHAAGATNGPLHIEVMMTPDGPCVIEINGRLGGSIPYIYGEVASVDLFREIGKIAVGIPPDTTPTFDRIGAMFNYHAPGEGRVSRLSGIDDAQHIPGVRRIMVAVHEGDQVSSLLGLLGGMIRIIAAASSTDELFDIRERAMAAITYEIEPA
jgi:biotin carboxylase